MVGGWTPELPERLLAFGNQGIRDVVDVTRADELKRLRIILDCPEWEVSQRIADAIRPNLENVTPEMRHFVNTLIRLAPSETSAKKGSRRSLESAIAR